jgi:hypothetical protein
MSDYSTIGYDGSYSTPDKDRRSGGERWWNKSSVYSSIVGDVRSIMDSQKGRLDELLVYLQLYSNRQISGFRGAQYSRRDELTRQRDRLSLNVCRSVVNAVVAKISTNRTRPVFLTEGGNWKQQLMGKDLARFIDGQFYAAQIYKKNRQSFRDGCIFGTGPLKVYIDWSDEEKPEIRADRTLPGELWVDDVDGRYGEPSQLYHLKEMGREKVAAMYPDKASEIKGAGLIEDQDYYLDSLADPISVIEGWHLESAVGHGDGRQAICTNMCDLEVNDYSRRRFPFAIFRWLDAILGFLGEGLIYELVGIQVEINKILRKISQHMHLASSFVVANRGSKVIKEHLRNTPWTLLEYTGDKPTFETVAAISPEYFMQLDRLYAKAFETAGITQLFAQGLKPKGLDSGKALREFKDTESERFMDVSQAWEEFHLDIAVQMIELAREIEERTPGYHVMAKVEDGTLRKIMFKDVDLDATKYLMQPKPSSAFAKDPAAKFQQVKDLLEAIPDLQPYALKLLGYPDLESLERRITAPLDTIERITDDMIYEGKYTPPDAFIDMPMALSITRGKYQWAKNSGLPPNRLDMLVRFMTECQAKMEQLQEEEMAKQAQMQAQAMAAAAPGPEAIAGPGGGALGPQVGDVNIRPEITVEGPPPIPGA